MTQVSQNLISAILLGIAVAKSVSGHALAPLNQAPDLASLTAQREAVTDVGKFKLALPIADRVVQLEQSKEPHSVKLAQAMIARAHCRWGLRSYPLAQRDLDESLRLLGELGMSSGQDAANAESIESMISLDEDRLDDAQRYGEEVVKIERRIAPSSIGLAQALRTLGNIADKRGNFSEAITRLEESLAMIENVEPDSLEEATTLMNLATVNFQKAKYQESKRLYSHALSIASQRAPGSAYEAGAKFGVGTIALVSGSPTEAIRLMNDSLAIQSKVDPDSPQTARMLGNIAYFESLTGHIAEAEARFNSAISLMQRTDPGSSELALLESNLGGLAIQLGQFTEAKVRLAAALKDAKRTHTEFRSMPYILGNLAVVAETLGDYNDARTYENEAISLAKRSGSGDTILSKAQNTLGDLAMLQGDAAEAQRCYEEALSIARRTGDGTFDVALILGNLGHLATQRGDWAEARLKFDEALSIHQALAPEAMAAIISEADLAAVEVGSGQMEQGKAHLEVALAKLKSKYPDAQQLAGITGNIAAAAERLGDLRGAKDKYEEALALAKRRASMSLDEATLLSNLVENSAARHDQTALIHRFSEEIEMDSRLLERDGSALAGDLGAIGDASSASLQNIGWLADPASFYSWLPSIRGAGLTLESRVAIAKKTEERDPEVRRIATLAESAVKLETEFETKPRPNSMSHARFQSKLLELKSSRRDREAELARILSMHDHRLGQSLKIDLRQVQRRLLPDSALVEYLRINTWDEKLNEKGPDAYAAFVVPKSGAVRYVRLASAKAIESMTREFMKGVTETHPTKREKLDTEALGKRLYHALFTPLGRLPANVWVAPDAALHSLAFDALSDEKGNYLVEGKSLSFVGSGRDIAVNRVTAPTSKPVVMAVGNFDSKLDFRQGRAAGLNAQEPPRTSDFRGGLSAGKWPPLPNTESEATNVSKLLGVKPILGDRATEERLLSLVRPRVLHLATHGFFFPAAYQKPKDGGLVALGMGGRIGYADSPMLRSGIVLAGANDEDKLRAAGLDTGWVTALDISQLDLRGTELVVLSACDTGLGDVNLAEGVFGLQRAFRFAGAQSILMSLFEVPDKATSKLMNSFYSAWKPGSKPGSKQAALRAAKLKLLHNPKTRDPRNWAGFVLLGDR